MVGEDDLRGEERKIVSARLYRSEFASFIKVCHTEGKSINQKLREMVKDEIKKNFGEILENKEGAEDES